MIVPFLQLPVDAKRDDTRDAACALYAQIVNAMNMLDHLTPGGMTGTFGVQADTMDMVRNNLGDAAENVRAFVVLRLRDQG